LKQFKPRQLKCSQQVGFTLIEIVIALGITAIGIVSLVQAMQQNITMANELEKRMIASNLASDHLAQYRFDSLTDKIKTGTKNANVTYAGINWRVSRLVSETEVDNVFLVQVSVSLANGEANAPDFASLSSAVAKLDSI
jgi:general secretion pathway protein I